MDADRSYCSSHVAASTIGVQNKKRVNDTESHTVDFRFSSGFDISSFFHTRRITNQLGPIFFAPERTTLPPDGNAWSLGPLLFDCFSSDKQNSRPWGLPSRRVGYGCNTVQQQSCRFTLILKLVHSGFSWSSSNCTSWSSTDLLQWNER